MKTTPEALELARDIRLNLNKRNMKTTLEALELARDIRLNHRMSTSLQYTFMERETVYHFFTGILPYDNVQTTLYVMSGPLREVPKELCRIQTLYNPLDTNEFAALICEFLSD